MKSLLSIISVLVIFLISVALLVTPTLLAIKFSVWFLLLYFIPIIICIIFIVLCIKAPQLDEY